MGILKLIYKYVLVRIGLYRGILEEKDKLHELIWNTNAILKFWNYLMNFSALFWVVSLSPPKCMFLIVLTLEQSSIKRYISHKQSRFKLPQAFVVHEPCNCFSYDECDCLNNENAEHKIP